MIPRIIKNSIQDDLFQGKTIIITGPRQVGKNCQGRFVNSYYWRTHTKQEIDLIEETGGILNVKEFKWNEKAKARQPQSFSDAYPGSTFEVINPNNYMNFLI